MNHEQLLEDAFHQNNIKTEKRERHGGIQLRI